MKPRATEAEINWQNYAGDLALPPAALVIRTITSIFPSCRLYREEEAPAPHSSSTSSEQDFTNLVIFCRKGPELFTFREPTEADTLGSLARKHYLLPRHEVPLGFFNTREVKGRGEGESEGWFGRGWTGWWRGRQSSMERYQQDSAIGHWYIMRRVLPDVVWENW